MEYSEKRRQRGLRRRDHAPVRDRHVPCTLLEVPNGNAATILAQIVAALNNIAGFYPLQWYYTFVDVGPEAVGYVWHQTAVAGANRFQADTMLNAAPGAAAAGVYGPVMRNAAGARIYFPKTSTGWNQSQPQSRRRPAFHGFITNDGAAARRFTVLNLHAPFDTNIDPIVFHQSLCDLARDYVDQSCRSRGARADRRGRPECRTPGSVDPLLPGNVNKSAIRDAVVAAAVTAFFEPENDLRAIMREAASRGVAAGITALLPTAQITVNVANAANKAIAIAAAGASAALAASVQLPTAPPGATANAAAARLAAINVATAQVGQYIKKTTLSGTRTAMKLEAWRMADAALQPFTFGVLPLVAVDTAVAAGDFNVNYPDTIAYTGAQIAAMGGANAYTRLTNLVGAATNAGRTTRIGPTAFKGQRIYRYIPVPGLQNVNSGAPNYCPLNLASLAGTVTSFVTFDVWSNALQQLAVAQNIPFAPLVKNFGDVITAAFAMEVINNTEYYRANCYDNIFVRAGVVNQLASGPSKALPRRRSSRPSTQPSKAEPHSATPSQPRKPRLAARCRNFEPGELST